MRFVLSGMPICQAKTHAHAQLEKHATYVCYSTVQPSPSPDSTQRQSSVGLVAKSQDCQSLGTEKYRHVSVQ